MKHVYIVYDSRASYDVDDACVIEVVSEGVKPSTKQLSKEYGGMNYVLVQYDEIIDKKGRAVLTNETVLEVIP